MKRLSVLLVLALLLSASACGDDDKDKDDAAGSQDASATSTTVPGGVESPSLTATTTPGGTVPGGGSPGTTVPGGTTGTTAAGGTTQTTKAPFPVEIKLDRTCVRRGTTGDMQGLRVKTNPEEFVGYSTLYQGPKNEMSNPEWKTGYGFQKSDKAGNFYAQWFVPDTAPTGEATLQIIADGRRQPDQKFMVVAANEKCP